MFITTHSLTRGIGQLRHRSSVYVLELDYNIQRGFAGIVGTESTYSEAHFRSVFKIIEKLLGTVEVKAVAEQEHFCFRIYAVAFVMLNHLLSPLVGIAAVVAYARIVINHRASEVEQEKVGCNRIGQRGTVVTVVLRVPILHSVVVGKRKRNLVYTLVHLHVLVGVSTDWRKVILHSEIHVRRSDAFIGFFRKTLYHNILPFTG